MKHILSIIVLSVLVTCLSAADASAKAGHGKQQGKHCAAMRTRLLKHFDADKDGKLSEAERAAAQTAIAQRRQQRLATFKQKHPKLYARADKNNDGTLSRDEIKALRGSRNGKAGCKHNRGQRISDRVKDRRADKKRN